ncbi:hypothetical protein [Amycolatopsis sp. 195334CR]|uniref:hypothetical protein n=1 Tax=Amycolatopsis sp. 195334CR TaxID=2814588 RepID=UPI001A8F423E|nr:hypothetical protein [Amycolatopsis sp. 195334CR]MBN6039415.1 hypothetical protein [Amycolatopsis sp. 195334CR]
MNQPHDPYGQQPYGGYGQYPPQQPYPAPGGWPGEPNSAKQKNRGLIAGLVIGAVLLVGVAVTLVVVLTGGEEEPPAAQQPPALPPPASSSAAPSKPAPSSSAATGRGSETPEEAGEVVIEALNTKDAQKYATIACNVQKEADVKGLQDTWDRAGDISAKLAKPVETNGDSATVTVRVEGGGNFKETPFKLVKQREKWCIPG